MLDFRQLVGQLDRFATRQEALMPMVRASRLEALKRLQTSANKWEQDRQRILESHTSWLTPLLYEPTNAIHPLPPTPRHHQIVAVDGSQIVPDRHEAARCCLWNIGTVILRYGETSSADLNSVPILDMPEDTDEAHLPMELPSYTETRISIQRWIMEIQGLVEAIRQELNKGSSHIPLLAMMDGSLILWSLESEDPTNRAAPLSQMLDAFVQLQDLQVPLIGYISRPMSRDVINGLKVSVCPHLRADCDHYCPNRKSLPPKYKAPDCIGTEGVTDAEMFRDLLAPGERSALYGTRSKIVNLFPADHGICFFYLHTGKEIARIELPTWVGMNTELLNTVHSLAYDQAQKGDGYPVALAEAHEQAIVRAPERAAFFHLIEQNYIQKGLQVEITRKAMSKRTRRI